MSRHPIATPDRKAESALSPDATYDFSDHPPSEEQLGGGNICSLEEEASTDDGKPLD